MKIWSETDRNVCASALIFRLYGGGNVAGVIEQVLAVGEILIPSIHLIFQKDEARSSVGAGVSHYNQGAIAHILFRAAKTLGQKSKRIIGS